MYISLWKLLYPKPEEIKVIVEDVADALDKEEHSFNIKVLEKTVLSLTHTEAMRLHNELGKALHSYEELSCGK